MKKTVAVSCAVIGTTLMLCASAAHAGPPKDPPTKCAPDAVLVGAVCMDKYEASVWRIPATNPAGKSNAGLIKKVRKGKSTVTDLQAGGAAQLGSTGDDYAPCNDQGQNCANDIFAVSLPGVTPARYITWLQAQEACTNSGKRLPSNIDWQAAANGTPDPGPDNGLTDCNTASTFTVASTGSRTSCVSARGAFDMVGNLYEWVADWVPTSEDCTGWGGFSATGDDMCLAGADAMPNGPGVLRRGGDFGYGAAGGPLAVDGLASPASFGARTGFRCAR